MMLAEIGIGKFSVLATAFLLTIIGVQVYRKIAVKFDIVARRNFRTLHKTDVPKGSGIVFSLVYITLVFILWTQGLVSNELSIAICLGGFAATIFGFIDDVIDVPAIIKLIVQISLCSFIVLSFGESPLLLSTTHAPIKTGVLGMIVSVGILVWLINLYNFMDGVDGMAASGAVFICGTISSVLFFASGNIELGLIVALLASSCSGFLIFNWPPASIFMGDAGSVFIGYVFGVLIMYTMLQGDISIWTWITVFGYFGIDTTTTLVLRIIHVKKWYGAHRSHAYQNLARIWDSHSKVLAVVICYHLLWVLPLTILSISYAQYQEIICLLATFPVIIWTLKYGPLLSSD